MGRKRQAVGHPDSADVQYCGEGDPLLSALFENDVEGAERLLQLPTCNVEVIDQMGWRPLHRAAFGGHDSIIEMLLSRRADVGACDHDGLQPLHIAASGGHVRCVELLLAAGAQTDVPDVHGLTPQFYALLAQGDHADAIRSILGVNSEDPSELFEQSFPEGVCTLAEKESDTMQEASATPRVVVGSDGAVTAPESTMSGEIMPMPAACGSSVEAAPVALAAESNVTV